MRKSDNGDSVRDASRDAEGLGTNQEEPVGGTQTDGQRRESYALPFRVFENVLIGGLAAGGFSPFSLASLLSRVAIQSATVVCIRMEFH